jgi:hypothetical protein
MYEILVVLDGTSTLELKDVVVAVEDGDPEAPLVRLLFVMLTTGLAKRGIGEEVESISNGSVIGGSVGAAAAEDSTHDG